MDHANFHFSLARTLFAIGSLIWALEYFLVRDQVRSRRILSWDVGQLRYLWSSQGVAESAAQRLYGERGATAWIAARGGAGALLAVPGLPAGAYAFGFAVAAASALGWYLRTPQGQDGSDQVFLLLAVSLGLAHGVDTPFAYSCAATFIAAQLAICYVTAGLTKALSPEWRDGRAIRLVFRTYIYGHGWVFAWACRRGVACVLAWGVIAFEVAFPVVFVLPLTASVAALAVPLGFHLATAIFMGLNLFLVSFLAGYPLLVLVLQGLSR